REKNYDHSQPVIMATWNGQEEPACIDGHTRMQAAINAGIESIPVFTHEYDDEQEALEKAIRLQRNRRNMTDAEILVCVEALDNRRPRGGDRRSAEAKSKPQRCGIENSNSPSAKQTGEVVGISTRKVELIRTIMDHADPEILQAVKGNQMSINKAAKETQKKRNNAKAPKTSDKPEPTTAADAALNCGEEPEQETPVDEASCCSLNDDATIRLRWEHYRALKELGGSIDNHVDMAIDMYLSMCLSMSDGGQVETDDDAWLMGEEEDEDSPADRVPVREEFTPVGSTFHQLSTIQRI